MRRFSRVLGALLAVLASVSAAAAEIPLTEAARLRFLRQAESSVPSGRGNRTLLQGPELPPEDRFTFNEEVRCRFREPDPKRVPGGKTPKFWCERIVNGKTDSIRIKYQSPKERNDGIWGEILSTRLFWALDFPSDAVTPVRVTCENCPPRPWAHIRAVIHRAQQGAVKECDYSKPPSEAELARAQAPSRPKLERACLEERAALFEKRVELSLEDAIVETKYPARVLEREPDEGWSWKEFDQVAPGAARDALALLAAFVQHADNKAEQQRLVCLEEGRAGACSRSAIMIQDLGFTFGQGYIPVAESAPLEERAAARSLETASRQGFAAAPVWSDPAGCVTHLAHYPKTGMPAEKRISEAGRAFLARKLEALTDQDLRDLFTVARVERRGDSVADWVEAFKAKRARITGHRCPE